MAARPGSEDSYDFVVIGAGTSGCVIAARLSEDPGTRVLLIEAGPRDRNPWIHIPLGYGKTLANPKLNWMYESGPEPSLNGRKLRWPRGRGLGGSSSINGLLHVRGSAAGYDRWAAAGNPGWSHADVLPYFRRSEDHVLGAGELHGAGGPVGIEPIGWPHPLAEAYIEAAVQTGFARNDDFNGPVAEGVGYFHQTTRRGRRASASVAYLRPALKRPNLRVVADALVTRILFEGSRASGVRYRTAAGENGALAGREVILCGGTVASPQLLQLSGIGPAEFLASVGVAAWLDSPGVGDNLQDHYAANSTYEARSAVTLNALMANWSGRVRMAAEYALRRTGPLAMPAGTVGVFARTAPDIAEPDVQISYAPFTADTFGGRLHTQPAFRASVYVLRPRSRGRIRIVSPDPDAKPHILGNYLSDDDDRRRMIQALRLVRRIAQAPALAAFRGAEIRPGREVESDEALLGYILGAGGSAYHPVGTCRMGTDGVVDAELKVRGVTGLRVADASVMPLLVSGNTNAACLMIGEKCADLIRRGITA